MANKNFFQPVRMESQYVATKLQTVLFQADDENAACFDGELAVLGDFTQDPVYLNAFTAANAPNRQLLRADGSVTLLHSHLCRALFSPMR